MRNKPTPFCYACTEPGNTFQENFCDLEKQREKMFVLFSWSVSMSTQNTQTTSFLGHDLKQRKRFVWFMLQHHCLSSRYQERNSPSAETWRNKLMQR